MTEVAMTHVALRGEPTRLFYLDGSRRLAEAASPDSRVGLLYVVFMARGRAPRAKAPGLYVEEAVASSRRARQLNPQLPSALATNLDVHNRFDRIISLNRTADGGGWTSRLAAMAASPFELTMALDATVMVCTSELHEQLLRVHQRGKLDFAVNFGESALTGNVSKQSAFGPRPSRVEDVLPHNFAMLIRRGAGFDALRRRWSRALRTLYDDQVALRATLQKLSSSNYTACDGDASATSSWLDRLRSGRRLSARATIAAQGGGRSKKSTASAASDATRRGGGAGGGAGGGGGCVRVRVQRLTERALGLKSADKTMPGWRMVPPRYSRPVAGSVLLVHSGHASICEEANRDAPTARVLAQPRHGARPIASSTAHENCLRAMQAARRDGSAAWALAQRVCDQLLTPGGRGGGPPSPELVEPLSAFWAWLKAHDLTQSHRRSPTPTRKYVTGLMKATPGGFGRRLDTNTVL